MRWHRAADGDGIELSMGDCTAAVYKREAGRGQQPWIWEVFSGGVKLAKGTGWWKRSARVQAEAFIKKRMQ